MYLYSEKGVKLTHKRYAEIMVFRKEDSSCSPSLFHQIVSNCVFYIWGFYTYVYITYIGCTTHIFHFAILYNLTPLFTYLYPT